MDTCLSEACGGGGEDGDSIGRPGRLKGLGRSYFQHGGTAAQQSVSMAAQRLSVCLCNSRVTIA